MRDRFPIHIRVEHGDGDGEDEDAAESSGTRDVRVTPNNWKWAWGYSEGDLVEQSMDMMGRQQCVYLFGKSFGRGCILEQEERNRGKHQTFKHQEKARGYTHTHTDTCHQDNTYTSMYVYGETERKAS